MDMSHENLTLPRKNIKTENSSKKKSLSYYLAVNDYVGVEGSLGLEALVADRTNIPALLLAPGRLRVCAAFAILLLLLRRRRVVPGTQQGEQVLAQGASDVVIAIRSLL